MRKYIHLMLDRIKWDEDPVLDAADRPGPRDGPTGRVATDQVATRGSEMSERRI